MTEVVTEVAPERNFLHDLCNIMAVNQGLIHLILMKLKTSPTEITHDELITRLEKIMTSVERMNKIVFDRRAAIKSPIVATKDQ